MVAMTQEQQIPRTIYIAPHWPGGGIGYLPPHDPYIRTGTGIGDFTAALAQSLAPASLERARVAASKASDAVIAGYSTIDQALETWRGLQAKEKEAVARFGPALVPMNIGIATIQVPGPSMFALVPVYKGAEALRSFDKRVAALDVLFLYLGSTLGQLGLSLEQAGLKNEGGNLRQTAALMDGFRSGLKFNPPNGNGYYIARPQANTDRMALSQEISQAFAAKGLKFPTDQDKPEWWDTIIGVLAPHLGAEVAQGLDEAKSSGMGQFDPLYRTNAWGGPAAGSPGLYGLSSMGEPATIALAIIGIVKVALVVSAIVAALYAVATVVKNMYHASNAAADAALEYQKRKTVRAEQVAAGQLTQGEATELDKVDQADTRATVDQITEAAAKAGPLAFLKGLIVPGLVVLGSGILLTTVVPRLMRRD